MSVELVMALREAAPSVLSNCPVLLVRGGWGEVFAAGAKLRRVGPSVSAIGAPTVLSSCPSPTSRGGRGEVFAVAGCVRDAGVVWAGGLHSGRNARMRFDRRSPPRFIHS